MVPLAKLKKLAKGAVRGPWTRSKSGFIYAGNDKVAECPPCQGHRGQRNAKFIAAANPAVVLQMIERIEELERSESQRLGDLALRFDQEGDALLKRDDPYERTRGRNRKIAACSLAVESTRLHQEFIGCIACGSAPGQYHSPECPSVNAFTAGRIPHAGEGPSQ
tara:strand:+ start:7620 stop:8111 length:492 start_codon:yes stop_codon:yes gene_type:complete